mmetsp:Transcript_17794/g.24610  ORF Transcript_17794/g.24610 Transcript_17794/m.24610 type:complete len:333 (-) Transcript_17794:505-1503(-)
MAVDSKGRDSTLRMLCPQLGDSADYVGSAILSESARDHFQTRTYGTIRPLFDSLDGVCFQLQSARDRHFTCSTSREKLGGSDNISRHTHCVCQVALNFVQNVLGGASEDDGACLGILAVDNKGEVFVSEFLNLEQPCSCANIRLLGLLYAIYDGGATCPSNTVVVCLADAADGGDVVLGKVVHSQVTQPLLRDHNVGFKSHYLLANALDPILLHLQQSSPVLFLLNLDIGLALSLFVLQGAIHQQDPRVLNASLHSSGEHDVLVEHYSFEHTAVLNIPSRNLLNLGVLLDVNVNGAVCLGDGDAGHRVQGKVRNQVSETMRILGANTTVYDF